ncbi:MAG: exo-alpha-sialidase [Clostridia bacterium]|nr:exo-alpha-sialidase [Clostridia bacterium]
MKVTSKIIAILLCLAMTAGALIPCVSAAADVLSEQGDTVSAPISLKDLLAETDQTPEPPFDLDMLKVSYQFNTDKSAIRLVTTVDGLEYTEAGFVLTLGDQRASITIHEVYGSILGSGQTYTPTMAGAPTSEYFALFNVTDLPEEFSLLAKAFVTTSDGNTYFGAEREIIKKRGELILDTNGTVSGSVVSWNDLGWKVHTHTADEWVVTKEATYDSEGLMEGVCACGEKLTQVIAKRVLELDHALNSDGQGYSITGIGDWEDPDVVIPVTCSGLPITSIGAYAFYSCLDIESVTFAGTKAQWEGISKGTNWAPANLSQVTCSDGTVSVQHDVAVTTSGIVSNFSTKPMTYTLGDDISINLTFHGWPSITVDENGTLYAVSSARLRHSLPIGCNVLMKSTDGGVTWSNPVIIHDTPMDDRDTGIEYLGNGKFLVTFFTTGVVQHSDGKYYTIFLTEGQSIETKDHFTIYGKSGDTGWQTQEPAWASDLLTYWTTCNLADLMSGYHCLISEDYGENWEKYDAPVSAPHGAIQLANGDLFYVGHSNKNKIFAYVSKDGGLTWTLKSTIAVGTPYSMLEPHVAELPNGRLIATWRVNLTRVTIGNITYEGADVGGLDANGNGIFKYGDHYYRIYHDGNDADNSNNRIEDLGTTKPATLYSGCIYMAYSDDGGATWSKCEPVFDKNGKLINGYPPEMTVTPEGIVVLTYSIREPGNYTTCVTYSFDGGLTWEPSVTIRTASTSTAKVTDHGYPSTTYLGNGEFITVYYEDVNTQNQGILRYTKWTLQSGLSA